MRTIWNRIFFQVLDRVGPVAPDRGDRSEIFRLLCIFDAAKQVHELEQDRRLSRGVQQRFARGLPGRKVSKVSKTPSSPPVAAENVNHFYAD